VVAAAVVVDTFAVAAVGKDLEMVEHTSLRRAAYWAVVVVAAAVCKAVVVAVVVVVVGCCCCCCYWLQLLQGMNLARTFAFRLTQHQMKIRWPLCCFEKKRRCSPVAENAVQVVVAVEQLIVFCGNQDQFQIGPFRSMRQEITTAAAFVDAEVAIAQIGCRYY